MSQRWVVVLRNFDEDAHETLVAQHELLHLLVDLRDPSLRLTFRLHGERMGTDRMTARGSLICSGGARRGSDALLDLASVGLLPAYSLAHVPQAEPERPSSFLELLPNFHFGFGPPIKPDWAPLFDLIRRREKTITIDISARYSAGPQLGRRPPLSEFLGSDPGGVIIKALETVPDPAAGNVNVSITCWGDGTKDPELMRAYGRRISGVGCVLKSLGEGDEPQGLDCTPSEAIRIWHAPYGEVQGRGIAQRGTLLQLEARRLPKRGVSLGEASQIGPRYDKTVQVVSSWTDRMRHIYVVGKTGSGKTNLLKRIARQDISEGKGCLVVSPHEDLIDHLVDTAGSRIDDIVVLDFGEHAYTPVVNPLTMDVHSMSDYMSAIDEVTDIITDMTFHEFAGPVFRDNVRTTLLTAGLEEIRGDADPTISLGLDIVKDRQLRAWAEKVCRNNRRDLANEWSSITDLKASDVAEFTRWIAAKFSEFSAGGSLRAATSTLHGSPLSIRNIYREGKILLVHLPDTRLGARGAEFLGRLIFNRIYQEARSIAPTRRRDFMVHVDEFQRFVGSNLEVLVTEARKYRLGLTFAHQNLRQLQRFSSHEGAASSRLGEAIFSNVGTLITMRASGSDVEALARELQVREPHVRGIAQYEALARCTLAGEEQRAVTLRVPLESVPPNREARKALRGRMIREGYWLSKSAIHSSLATQLALMVDAADPVGTLSDRKAQHKQSVSDTGSGGSGFLDDWLAKRRARPPTSTPVRDSNRDQVVDTAGQEIDQTSRSTGSLPAPTPGGGGFLDGWLAQRQASRLSADGENRSPGNAEADISRTTLSKPGADPVSA